MDIKNHYLGPGGAPFSPECSGQTMQNTGMPCIHTVKNCMDSNEPLQLHHFHPHWQLNGDIPHEINPRLLLLNPAVVRSRGRPRGATNNPTVSQIQTNETPESTQREPSQHEYILAQENLGHGRKCGGKRGQRRG